MKANVGKRIDVEKMKVKQNFGQMFLSINLDEINRSMRWP